MNQIMSKPLFWVGSSEKELKRLPDAVQDRIGLALDQARLGFHPRETKRLKGLGVGILEVVAYHDGNTYRAVYTIRFKDAIYVLHVFQKKAKKGIATPKRDIDLVRQRLKVAQQHYATIQKG